MGERFGSREAGANGHRAAFSGSVNPFLLSPAETAISAYFNLLADVRAVFIVLAPFRLLVVPDARRIGRWISAGLRPFVVQLLQLSTEGGRQGAGRSGS